MEEHPELLPPSTLDVARASRPPPVPPPPSGASTLLVLLTHAYLLPTEVLAGVAHGSLTP